MEPLDNLIASAERIAEEFATGVADTNAHLKMWAKAGEMDQKAAGSTARLMDAIDAAYFAAIAHLNGLVNRAMLESMIQPLLGSIGHDLPMLVTLMVAKFSARIEREDEGKAVEAALEEALTSRKVVEIRGAILFLPDGNEIADCWAINEQVRNGRNLTMAASKLALPWLAARWLVDGEPAFPGEIVERDPDEILFINAGRPTGQIHVSTMSDMRGLLGI